VKYSILILILVFSLSIGCKKSKDKEIPCLSSEMLIGHGYLTNLTGFDGCGWVIQLSYKEPSGN